MAATTRVLGVGIEESLWTIFKSLTLVLCPSPCSHHWSMGKLQRFVIGTVRDCVDYVGSCERNRLRICCTFLTLSGACRTPQLAGEQRRGSTLGRGGRPLQIVARPPNLAVTLDTLWSIDSRKKISIFDASRCRGGTVVDRVTSRFKVSRTARKK